jgi:hypothetical protein
MYQMPTVGSVPCYSEIVRIGRLRAYQEPPKQNKPGPVRTYKLSNSELTNICQRYGEPKPIDIALREAAKAAAIGL